MPLSLSFDLSNSDFELLLKLLNNFVQVLYSLLHAIGFGSTFIKLLVDFDLLSVHLRELLFLLMSVSLGLFLEFFVFSTQGVSICSEVKYLALLLVFYLGGLVQLLEDVLEFDRQTFQLLILVQKPQL